MYIYIYMYVCMYVCVYAAISMSHIIMCNGLLFYYRYCYGEVLCLTPMRLFIFV